MRKSFSNSKNNFCRKNKDYNNLHNNYNYYNKNSLNPNYKKNNFYYFHNNINERSLSDNEDYFADDDNYDSEISNKFYGYITAKNKLKKSKKINYYGYGNKFPGNIRIEIKSPSKNDIEKENKTNLENLKRYSNISINRKSQSCQKIVPKNNNEDPNLIFNDNKQNNRKKLIPINSPSYKWVRNREVIDAIKKGRNRSQIDLNNYYSNNKKLSESLKNKRNTVINVKKINIKKENEEEISNQQNNINNPSSSKRKYRNQSVKDKKSSSESLKNYTNVVIEFPAINSYFH